MADRSAEIARFLIEENWTSADELFDEVLRRWPGLPREEWDRALAIAMEMARADHDAEISSLVQAMRSRGL